MPNIGAINSTITTQNGELIINNGYHNGNGIIKANIEAAAVSVFTNANLWLTGGSSSNLVDEPTTSFGKFKIKVGGSITVTVQARQYTSGANGTFSIYFYKNGVSVNTKYGSVTSTDPVTMTANITLIENDIIEIKSELWRYC